MDRAGTRQVSSRSEILHGKWDQRVARIEVIKILEYPGFSAVDRTTLLFIVIVRLGFSVCSWVTDCISHRTTHCPPGSVLGHMVETPLQPIFGVGRSNPSRALHGGLGFDPTRA